MNECEQLHPLLRGYIDNKLSGRERRLVARHLNLCASARKELDRHRSGVKPSAIVDDSMSVPWDQRLLNWMFRAPIDKKSSPPPVPKKSRGSKTQDLNIVPAKSRSSKHYIVWIALFFIATILVTHLVQNGAKYQVVKDTQRWLSKKGFHILGATPTLDMVLDITNLPHWEGTDAPVAFSYGDVIQDAMRFRIYWMFLQSKMPLPPVDFTKDELVIQFLGQKNSGEFQAKFKRLETYSDRSVVLYDETFSSENRGKPLTGNRPWTIQLIPKPTSDPVVIQKIP